MGMLGMAWQDWQAPMHARLPYCCSRTEVCQCVIHSFITTKQEKKKKKPLANQFYRKDSIKKRQEKKRAKTKETSEDY